MIRVIGFEGAWPDSAPVAWGAAALQDDQWIWNSLSGQRTAISEFNQLVSESLVPIDDLTIRDDYKTAPLVVVGIRPGPKADPYRADPGRLGGLVQQKRTKGFTYYVFKDESTFNQYAAEAAMNVASTLLLQRNIKASEALDVLNATLILAPSNPILHALRTTFSSDKTRATQVARRSLHTEQDNAAFEFLTKATTAQTASLWLKYHDGIAAGGGLETNVAARQFQAFDTVHRKLKPVLLRANPYLDTDQDLPSFRVRTLEAASADIQFGVNVEGESLIGRVARYLDLQLFQEVLRGQIPTELESDVEFLQAVETIIQPTADTRLFQRPLDSDEDEQVFFERFLVKNALPGPTMSLLGYAQGVSKDVRALEFRLSPTVREHASLLDNGHSEPPNGATIFHRRGDFLFKPTRFTIQIFTDIKGRRKLFLNTIQLLDSDGDYMLDSIPSSVVDGAFFRVDDLKVTIVHGNLAIGAVVFRTAQDPINLPNAARWLATYAAWCRNVELLAAANDIGSWVRSVHVKGPSALMRILLALESRDGRALISDLIADVNAMAGISVRRNNTRREIREHPDLVSYDPDDEERVRLEPQGYVYLKIYRAASADPSPR